MPRFEDPEGREIPRQPIEIDLDVHKQFQQIIDILRLGLPEVENVTEAAVKALMDEADGPDQEVFRETVTNWDDTPKLEKLVKAQEFGRRARKYLHLED